MSMNQLDFGVAPHVLAIPPGPAIPDDVRVAAERLGVGRYLSHVAEFTLEIFGSFGEARVVPDPEVPDDVHIIFDVPVTGSADEILKKDMLWSRRLLATIPRAPRVFSVAMNYQE